MLRHQRNCPKPYLRAQEIRKQSHTVDLLYSGPICWSWEGCQCLYLVHLLQFGASQLLGFCHIHHHRSIYEPPRYISRFTTVYSREKLYICFISFRMCEEDQQDGQTQECKKDASTQMDSVSLPGPFKPTSRSYHFAVPLVVIYYEHTVPPYIETQILPIVHRNQRSTYNH